MNIIVYLNSFLIFKILFKQSEQEQDAMMMERIKKEEEMRKKKEQEDSLTLEQTKEQVN